MFGGRSAQLDGITEPVHAGFDTNYNSVVINNGIGDKTAAVLDKIPTLTTFRKVFLEPKAIRQITTKYS